MRRIAAFVLSLVLAASLSTSCALFVPGLTSPQNISESTAQTVSGSALQALAATPAPVLTEFDFESIPQYSGEPFVSVNGGVPYFELPYSSSGLSSDASVDTAVSEESIESFETYSALDTLGRCGPAYAAVGLDLMPTQERESIREVRPSGWKQAMYDNVEGNALYNRCHLLGYQLTAENANPNNLITGTRYMNTQGMLPFENMVADYVHETGNHVLYRVTPVFVDDELVARGVLMEAASMEDNGEGVLYCVFAYNVQPGIGIDYQTGESWSQSSADADDTAQTYVLNTGTRKFHKTECASVQQMNPERKQDYTGGRADLLAQGYAPCGSCKP